LVEVAHLGLELVVSSGWDVALGCGEVFLGNSLNNLHLGGAAR